MQLCEGGNSSKLTSFMAVTEEGLSATGSWPLTACSVKVEVL